MKKSTCFTLVFLGTFVGVPTVAQECNGYFAFQKGVKMQMVSYDKKDRPIVTLNYEVVNSKPVSGGTEFTLKNETYDSKGKLLATSDMTTRCVNGDFYTDVRNLSNDMMPKSADMEVSVTGDQLIYPAVLKAGQMLKDAAVSSKVGMKGGMTLMTMNVNITGRQVEGFEAVETPAGKFDCVKISSNSTFKLMGTRTYKSVEYLAKGVGLVKSEQYDEKGNKQSSMMLTKLER